MSAAAALVPGSHAGFGREKVRQAVAPQSVIPVLVYSTPSRGSGPVLQFHSFDAKYLELLRSGDRATQDHFVAYFTQLLRLKLRSRVQGAHVVDDLCQETFARVLTVLRKENGLRQAESLGAFVNTVCNHVLLEHYRASGRVESLDAEDRPELPAHGADALEHAVARQIREKVRQILHLLPARDRGLLQAVFLEERDRDEVCRQFGVDRDYLRVLLHRAKQEFKTEYLRRMGSGAVPVTL